MLYPVPILYNPRRQNFAGRLIQGKGQLPIPNAILTILAPSLPPWGRLYRPKTASTVIPA